MGTAGHSYPCRQPRTLQLGRRRTLERQETICVPCRGFLDLVCGQHMVPKDALKVSGKGPIEFTKMLTATVSGLAKGEFS